jgi:hypothetical protein
MQPYHEVFEIKKRRDKIEKQSRNAKLAKDQRIIRFFLLYTFTLPLTDLTDLILINE